jgi:hypothetical protein
LSSAANAGDVNIKLKAIKKYFIILGILLAY